MNNPLISVVVPLFNGSKYIIECVRSILAQTLEDLEILIVDDGSRDDGVHILRDWQTSQRPVIRLLQHPDGKNLGISASRNAGIRNARGSWIAFLDQDDLWLPNKLETQMALVERSHNRVAMAYSKIGFIDADGTRIRVDGFDSAGKGADSEPRNIFHGLLSENFVPCPTVVVKRDVLLEAGLFDEGRRHQHEDWIVWSKIAYRHSIVFTPAVLAYHRIHTENFSAVKLSHGLDIDADFHHAVTVFSHLLQKYPEDIAGIRQSLVRRSRQFFLKARSWGVGARELFQFEEVLSRTFSDYRVSLKMWSLLIALIPSFLARAMRRVRRRIVKV